MSTRSLRSLPAHKRHAAQRVALHRVLLCASALCLVASRQPASAAERPTIGRVGVGVQLGGFYDLGDPGLELRGWAKGLGLSLNLGRHKADPSYPGFTEVSSEPGEQVTAGLLVALISSEDGRAVPIRLYATAGIVHATQARGRWESITPAPDGTTGEAGVEGATGSAPFAGIGGEIGFRALRGLALGGELLLALGGSEGTGPGVRFGVRYYPW